MYNTFQNSLSSLALPWLEWTQIHCKVYIHKAIQKVMRISKSFGSNKPIDNQKKGDKQKKRNKI